MSIEEHRFDLIEELATPSLTATLQNGPLFGRHYGSSVLWESRPCVQSGTVCLARIRWNWHRMLLIPRQPCGSARTSRERVASLTVAPFVVPSRIVWRADRGSPHSGDPSTLCRRARRVGVARRCLPLPERASHCRYCGRRRWHRRTWGRVRDTIQSPERSVCIPNPMT